MNVSQRGTSFSYAHDGTTAAYNLDRFYFIMRSHADEYDCTIAQVADSPDGFANSLKITTGTAESAVGSDEYYSLFQAIEAQNLQSLAYGTSSAKTITVSFYVKSSLTGTFAFTLYQGDDVRVINKTYTINSADTWERKTITIAGDTTGVIEDDNGVGFIAYWNFATGSDFDGASTATTWTAYSTTNYSDSSATDALITTAGATWQITGVQMEIGEKATAFEHELFSESLKKCHRYYTKSWTYGSAVTTTGGIITAACVGNVNRAFGNVFWPTEMRQAPTVTWYSGETGTSNKWRNNSDGADITAASAMAAIGTKGYGFVLSAGISAVTDSLHGHYEASAEL
jgi:hypothetical protein